MKFKSNLAYQLYTLTMTSLAVISILLLIGDYNDLIKIDSYPWNIANDTTWFIFTVDYIARFYIADNKKKFFLHNIFDLLAIIPFDQLFSAFRIFRAFRLLKLFRALRVLGFTGRLIKNIHRFLKVTGIRWVMIVTVALIFVSAIMFSLAEKIPFWDSVWWSIVTTTTVGYGDIAPVTLVGRCVATVLMFTGIGIVGIITSEITNYFSKSNQASDSSSDRIDKILNELQDIKQENKRLSDKIDKLQTNNNGDEKHVE